MIQPIITANQTVNRSMPVSPVSAVSFGKMSEVEESDDREVSGVTNPVTSSVVEPSNPESVTCDSANCGEKLDINFQGCREYSLNGNKIDYFA